MTLDMTCHAPVLEGRIIRIMSCLITLEFLVHLFLERRFASCSLRFSRLPTPLCTLLWQNWGKMAQAAEEGNAPIFQKWAFFDGEMGGDTTRPSQKRRARPLQNLFSRILFDYVEETTHLEQVALFYTPKSVYQSDVVGLDFSEADSQCDQSNSGLLPGKGVRCPRLG